MTNNYAAEGIMVTDTGSFKTVSDFSFESMPRVELRTVVSQHTDYIPSLHDYINEERSIFPIRDGYIESFDEATAIWKFAKTKLEHLEHKSIRNYIFAEHALTPKRVHAEMGKYVFEEEGAKSLMFYSQPRLCMHASLKQTAIVLDIGYTKSTIYAAFEDTMLTRLVQDVSVGGRQVDEYLCQKLNLPNHYMPRVEQWKRNCWNDTFELPDGSLIQENEHWEQCVDVLCDPTKVGMNKMGVVEAYSTTLDNLKEEYYEHKLSRSTLLVGDGSNLVGVVRRIRAAHATCAGRNCSTSVQSSGSSAWVGGCMLGSLSTYSPYTADLYAEYGDSLFYRKIWYM